MLLRTLRSARRRRGVAAVEMAMLSPLLLALLLGIWEVGRLIQVNQMLSNAAREGGRQAASGLLTDAEVQTVVLQYLQRAGIPTAHATVTVTNLTSGSRDAKDALQLDQLQVSVTVPVTDIKWVALSLITGPTSTLSATTVWWSLRDQGYPKDITPPSGS